MNSFTEPGQPWKQKNAEPPAELYKKMVAYAKQGTFVLVRKHSEFSREGKDYSR